MAERLNRRQIGEAFNKVEDKIGEYRAFNMGLQGADEQLSEVVEERIAWMRYIQAGMRVLNGEVDLEEVLRECELAEVEGGRPFSLAERGYWENFRNRMEAKQFLGRPTNLPPAPRELSEADREAKRIERLLSEDCV